MQTQLIISKINKHLEDGTVALENINFSLGKGERLSILGPSGSGKTTLLRVISGLEEPESGKIFFDGKRIDTLPAHKRNFGFMFQDYALFPHLNVMDNIGFGLKMRGEQKKNITARVDELLELTGLSGFQERRIDDLSGGEAQRVALARTLAGKPGLLLLDEPLSSLDRMLRKKLLGQMRRILSELKTTTIFVTHDHEEAFAVADHLMLMNEGRIVQTGTRDQIVKNPENDWVSKFLGITA